jgi:hypothetical protein
MGIDSFHVGVDLFEAAQHMIERSVFPHQGGHVFDRVNLALAVRHFLFPLSYAASRP